MSKVVWYSSAQKVLEVLNTIPPIAFTVVDLSTFVPDGATAIIMQAEIEATLLLVGAETAIMHLRKNAAQGVCCIVQVQRLASPLEAITDNGIVPITADRKFEYDLTGLVAIPRGINLRVYALGYLV